MPGLIRGVARTAVIAGTATVVSNRVSQRQAERWAHQGQGPYGARAAATAAPPAAPINQLNEFGELRDKGVLAEEEFAGQKAKLLGS